MKTLTVFTPTYNRAYLLPRLYESLCNQTSLEFVWLIIDDGSVDNTKELVESWIIQSDIEIKYHYKDNGGMHTAHNLAYSLIETELNVCIDSDDYMPVDAIHKILDAWCGVEHKESYAGIIGLDADFNNNILGSRMPLSIKEGSLADLYNNYGGTGDKKIVLRTDVVNQYPNYPEYKGEKLVPLGILYLMIGKDFKSIYLDDILCNVEYQKLGSSNTIQKQYFLSPKGFAYAKSLQKQYTTSWILHIKYSLHIGISSCITKNFRLLNQGPKAYLNWVILPIAFGGTLYLKWKNR